MGFIHISVGLKALDRPNDPYEADFLVYTGAMDTLAPYPAWHVAFLPVASLLGARHDITCP